jgi:hypothetical protein
MDISLNNPSLPLFIVNELNRNPEAIVSDILLERNLDLNTFFEDLTKLGKVKQRSPNFHIHAFVSMLSLTLYPFIGKTLINTFLGVSEKDYPQFIEERKGEVVNMVLEDLGLKG